MENEINVGDDRNDNETEFVRLTSMKADGDGDAVSNAVDDAKAVANADEEYTGAVQVESMSDDAEN